MSFADHDLVIMGVGCTSFGEKFESSVEDMIVEATYEAYQDAEIDPSQIQAAWYGNCFPDNNGLAMSGSALGDPLGLIDIPITRVENQCCTGMDAFRNACYAVASGEVDVALAVGAEKMRDVPTKSSLNATIVEAFHPLHNKGITSPGLFGLQAPRWFHDFGIDKTTLAKIAVMNRENGTRNPKAHFQKAITEEQALNSPMVSYPLSVTDCCPVTDGAAAVIISKKEKVKRNKKGNPKILSVRLLNEFWLSSYAMVNDFHGFRATRKCAELAYKDAQIMNPLNDLDFAEVHDCFTITEIMDLCDLGFCEPENVRKHVEAGTFAPDGILPVNSSGGLIANGHPIGATGIRMVYNVTNQLLGRAGKMQIPNATKGLAHNLGGPGSACCITILSM